MRKNSLSFIMAAMSGIIAGMRANEREPFIKTNAKPARAPFGKRSGGSRTFRLRGHPLFQRKRIKNAQPFGEDYNLQVVDDRHWHPRHVRWDASGSKARLKRPTFA